VEQTRGTWKESGRIHPTALGLDTGAEKAKPALMYSQAWGSWDSARTRGENDKRQRDLSWGHAHGVLAGQGPRKQSDEPANMQTLWSPLHLDSHPRDLTLVSDLRINTLKCHEPF
jgi:hypothetical protein